MNPYVPALLGGCNEELAPRRAQYGRRLDIEALISQSKNQEIENMMKFGPPFEPQAK